MPLLLGAACVVVNGKSVSTNNTARTRSVSRFMVDYLLKKEADGGIGYDILIVAHLFYLSITVFMDTARNEKSSLAIKLY